MKQKIGFGTALPNGGFQYTVDRDPNPRGAPWAVEAPVTRSEAMVWAGVALLIFCVISLVVTL